MKVVKVRKMVSKPNGNYYKPSWTGTESIDWNELAARVQVARQGKPKKTEAQVIAQERRQEMRGERRFCNRQEF
jgi:hypothetical protein